MSLQEIQMMSLDIMRDVHEFRVENKIRYTLAYGTLIGAIRHKGFIPWYDDIDVMMPRDDWEIFNKTFKSKRGYDILTAYDERSYQIYTKVYDSSKTKVISPAAVSTLDLGVWIDIMPIDGLPDTYDDFNQSYSRLCELLKIILNKRYKMSSGKQTFLGLLWSIKHRFLFMSINECVKEFHCISKQYALSGSHYCSNLCCREALDKNKMELLLTEDFNEYVLADFEGEKFYIASGYDRILRIIFGDYMQLPPKDKQVVGHASFKYLMKDK